MKRDNEGRSGSDIPKPRPSGEPVAEPTRTGMGVETLKRAILDSLFYVQARFPEVATRNDWYQAVSYTIRDRLLHRWIRSAQGFKDRKARTVCYFSAEFLLGPHLAANLLNLGILDETRQAVRELGLDFDELTDQEEEPGLGNGGLGRLAACFMESLATLQVPAIGYGIRYEFGIFDQKIENGWQVEVTDKWLRYGNPWEVPRPKIVFPVRFGGRTEHFTDGKGRHRVRWLPEWGVNGIAYDTPILGYGVPNVNLLRLWSAQACESFDFQAFNVGDYYGAVEEKLHSENITKVLYPNDEPAQGKSLRLMQQYFFVSCSLQDMIRIHLQVSKGVEDFHAKYAVQLNDTHPAIAVAELMRLLLDVQGMDWEPAWEIARATFGYTNHTLLPEALEKWPVPLFGALLPRHLEIIYEINRRFLDGVRERYPGDADRVRRLSLIDESGPRYVRMAHLASVGSHAINGVAALHSELLKSEVLRDFHELSPEKFSNKTNGVTPRRFVVLCNPGLAALISEKIGGGWIRNLDELRKLERFAGDPAFQEEWKGVKHRNKKALALEIRKRTGVAVDPGSLFDVQVKRIHEYKRQHLNVLHIVTLFNRIKRDPHADCVPRTFLFAGKAAPGYFIAKRIIKLVHAVGEVVNRDPDVAGRLRVAFFPDYNVKNGMHIFPGADLSEQISTAGKEASGTGNMKLSLNGALTIGTLDGANVEIREEVGAENFFEFGLSVEGVAALWARGYRPMEYYERDPELREALDRIASGFFTPEDPGCLRPIVDGLLHHDDYMLLADYRSYVECQERVSEAYRDPARWTRMSILNVARMGKFSSDRTIREYCDEIWDAPPMPTE